MACAIQNNVTHSVFGKGQYNLLEPELNAYILHT
jgi:hypothetical protein